MAREIGVFYAPDDDGKHALQFGNLQPGINGGLPLLDVWFTPSNKPKSTVWPALLFTPMNTLRAVAGAYCPIDQRRYAFFSTGTDVLWTRYPSAHPHNAPKETIIDAANPFLGLTELGAGLVDMAAHFNGSALEIAILRTDGLLVVFRGTPWTAQTKQQLQWTQVVGLAGFGDAQRIAISEAAGAGHVFVASNNVITEVFYFGNTTGSGTIATFTDQILDVGNVFTPADGVMHVVVATADPQSGGSTLFEAEFVPAVKPPQTRQLGTVNFRLAGLGAYLKPDGAQHIIMSQDASGVAPLFLSWGAPDLSVFDFGLFPPRVAA